MIGFPVTFFGWLRLGWYALTTRPAARGPSMAEVLGFHLERVIKERDAYAAELERAESDIRRLRGPAGARETKERLWS